MQEWHLFVGGLVALGFDSTGRYLLTVSHSGRGVFDALNWSRVARDIKLAYPEEGFAIGIGPIEGQRIAVTKIDSNGTLRTLSPDGRTSLDYEAGTISVTRNT